MSNAGIRHRITSAVTDVVYRAYDGIHSSQVESCAICLEDLANKAVHLHCGHSFCACPCFKQLIVGKFEDCPLCKTPMIVMHPDLDYFRMMNLFKFTTDAVLEQTGHIDRLQQFRMIHDGHSRPQLLALHGGVPDDFLKRVRSTCRTCKFGSARGQQRGMQDMPTMKLTAAEKTASQIAEDPDFNDSASRSTPRSACQYPSAIGHQDSSLPVGSSCTGMTCSPISSFSIDGCLEMSPSSRQFTPMMSTFSNRRLHAQIPAGEHDPPDERDFHPDGRQSTPMFLPGIQDNFTGLQIPRSGTRCSQIQL
eukprot:TRINITY_DN4655_c0_g1_i2.p1 TRINITY_DN4655_c0_g1~~TRINITY_DN4655_c0_g1_i2.p1  ORF type:complete len:307 (-),score=27.75 TRINITY_DN4655_c0_g1_i2:791-1711(-)